MFEGTYTAIVTPFTNDGIDYVSFQKLVEEQITAKIDGIVFLGSTGESSTVTHDEYHDIIEFAVKTVNHRTKVIIGTGTNSTIKTIENTQLAYDLGADAVLIVSPYYNKPTQQGLYRHFEAIATTINIPVILYNIQSRTGVNLSLETILQLSKFKNIVAIKEASGNFVQMMEIINAVSSDFTVLSGDDILTLPLIMLGGKGVISVLSNIIPRRTCELVNLALSGKIDDARMVHYQYMELINALFIETNPSPVKEALSLMGKCSNKLRLPLCNMTKENQIKLKKLLQNYYLI